ncbi:MAG: RDD family protein [Reichenbachiella sp.]
MAIYINTNQNVQINYEISSIGDRLIAYLIDSLIIAGIGIGIFFIGMATNSFLGFSLLFAAIFFYHLICEIIMNGQSVGKRNRGIRVMKKDGNAASLSAYFLRFLLRPIDNLYGLGLAIIFFTDKNQRLGDLAAGTVVINVKNEEELKQQIREEMTVSMDEDIKYPHAAILSDREIQIIRTILKNRVEAKQHENIHELAKKIASKINVNYEGNGSYYFLKRVVQDYYKTHSN